MLKGIDISTFQGDLDYNELKASGIDFAIIRCGYGKDAGQKDAMFETHYQGCKEAGIKVGVYHYSYCTSIENAEKEAEACLECIDGKELDLPIFYDIEEKRIIENCDPTEITLKFAEKIKQAGYDVGVYASLSWFDDYFWVDTLIDNNIKIWLAQWNREITANFPVDIWQYTNNNDFGFDGDYLVNESLLDNNSEPMPEPEPEFEIDICKSLAVDVIFGKYGNGDERKQALGNYYEEVQNIVNEIYNTICV